MLDDKLHFMGCGTLDQKKQTILIKVDSLHLYATTESAGNDSNFSKKIPVDFAEQPRSAVIIKRTFNQCVIVLESWILQCLPSTDMLFRLFSGSEQVFSHYLELPQHFQI